MKIYLSRHLYLLLMLGCFSLSIVSCANKDDEDNGLITSEIVGTWKFSEVSTDNGSSFTYWPLEETYATFNSNGTYEGKGYFGNGTGTWKKKGNIIITYVEGEEFYRYEIKEHTSLTCTLIMSLKGSDSTIWVKCIKTDVLPNDDNTITKATLESITAFVCNDNGNMIYLKFRDGHIYTKEITKDGTPCNMGDIEYHLSGVKISMEFMGQKPSGTIYKVTYNNGEIGIILNLNGTYGIAKWLSKTFKQCNYEF